MEQIIKQARTTKVETEFSLKLFNYIIDNAKDEKDYKTIMSNLIMWMK